MTNKLEISRELAERIEHLLLDAFGGTQAGAELRALLAAPVVEATTCAQCKASTADFCNQNGCGYLESGNGAPVVERQGPVTSQVPVLRAMAANYRNGHSWDFLDGEAVNKAADEITRLQAYIAELERGRGVVAAYRIQHPDGYWYTWGSGPVSEGDLQDVADGVLSGIEVAYAAPPAPIAVVLPECRIDGLRYSDGWNACLDKVKELNQ